MTTARTETTGQRSDAPNGHPEGIPASGHSLGLASSHGLLVHQSIADHFYRSPYADTWIFGVGAAPTNVIGRQPSPSRPDDGELAVALRALTDEVAELRQEVASLRELMALPVLSVREQRQRQAELFEEFVNLAARWQAETAGASTTWRIVSHPAYLRMIGMGDRAVPWILDQLEGEEAHWFEALHAITGANPVPDEDRGVYAKMAQAWLAWGRDNGWIA